MEPCPALAGAPERQASRTSLIWVAHQSPSNACPGLWVNPHTCDILSPAYFRNMPAGASADEVCWGFYYIALANKFGIFHKLLMETNFLANPVFNFQFQIGCQASLPVPLCSLCPFKNGLFSHVWVCTFQIVLFLIFSSLWFIALFPLIRRSDLI